jgi:hypothetical protein
MYSTIARQAADRVGQRIGDQLGTQVIGQREPGQASLAHQPGDPLAGVPPALTVSSRP